MTVRVLKINHSGVVDAWRERERALSSQGVEVHTLAARVWNEGGVPVPLVPRPHEPVRGVRTVGSHPALFLYDPAPLWRALGERWDVIDLHEEPFALCTAEVLLIRALRGVRTPYVLYSAQNIRKRYPIPFRWFERWALTHASGLSVCNTEAGRICEDKGFPGAAAVIPLGVDTSLFQPRGGGRREEGPVVVGYAGRLEVHKGVAVLLDAVAREPGLRLRVAGAGPEDAALRRRAASPDLAGRVDFVGGLDVARLAEFYRGVDVVAVPSLTTPSWTEQFGRVVVEAMACGTPVVASDSGALPDLVTDAGVLVPPGDPVALAEALVRVGTDAELAGSLREAGLRRAATCDWRRVAERYLDLYRTALHQVRPETGADERALEVVVVAYGSPDLLARALEPLRALPVTVVDNSSSAAVRRVAEDAGVRYIDAGRNGGFAAGVNIGLAQRGSPDADVLLVNPDARVEPADVDRLRGALLADDRLAAVAPAQVDGAGRRQRVAWPFPSPLGTWVEALGLGRYRCSSGFVTGSVLLLRAEALRQVGGFDERFFLYAEETDWQYRATRLGWRVALVPGASATHVGGATSSDAARRERHFHASQERYIRKHFGSWGWQLARAGQVAGAGVRSALLPRDRARAAAERARLYVDGPVRAEARMIGSPG